MPFITALGRAATRLAKTGTLLGLTAGLPYALIIFIGWPLPRTLPGTGADVQHLLTSPITDTMIIDLLAVALWLLWTVFTASVVAEIVASLRGVRPPRLRAVAPVQGLAAWLLSGITAGVVAAATLAPTAANVHTTAPAIPAVHFTSAPTSGARAENPARDHRTGPMRPAEMRSPTSDPRRPQLNEAVGDAAPASRFALAAHDGPLTVTAAGKHWTVTVHRGDTLWDLADAWLGDPTRWPDIYHLNTDRYDHNGRMRHGGHIETGWRLTLPDDATAPPGAAPVHPGTPGSTQPATAVPSGPTPIRPSPSNPIPSPSVTSAKTGPTIGGPSVTAPTARVAPSASPTTASPIAVESNPAPQATTSTPAPRHSAPTGSAPGQAAPDHGGVDIGETAWVALDVAAAVSGAAALLWIHRRRRYRPQPVNSRRRDTDLTPLPATIAALHHAHTPAEDTTMTPPAPDVAEAATVTTAALGAYPGHRTLRMHDLPALGVGLTGPGALPAARGVLGAVLSAGGPWAADTEATIITTPDDLTRLLDTTPAPDLDRLHIVDDPLLEAERQLLYRARTAADDDITGAADAPQLRLPGTVILTAAPTGAHARRLAAILTIGARLGITAVLTGAWLNGDTWTVTITGTTTTGDGTAGPRLNVLDAAATADILDTLDQARPSTPDLPPPTTGPRPAPTTANGPAPIPAATSPRSRIPSAPDNPSARTGASRTPDDDPVVATMSSNPQQTPSGPLYLTVLGRPHLDVTRSDGRAELRIRRSDGIQILVHLAVDRVGATSDQLMAALWPEVRPRYARGRFHTTMSELRGLLIDATGTETILRTGERYHLDPKQVTVDLWDLNDAIERASITLDPAAHIAALREVIALHTGVVADGNSWLWLYPHREATRRRLLDAYVALADTEPDPQNALAHIQDAISLDPYNEDVYQRAMRLHARLGNTEGIRRTLRALSERLTELEIRVSPQTQQVATDLIGRVDARRRIAGTAA